uniref:Uncharacterized protein n=1 Tax=Anguilla anguilla TaxID=7936 RepID=A0A0E9X0D7_ANGAN
MPRRKQLNPQPVKLDSEDGLGSADPASFVLESDFLLERHLQFDENDTEHQILEPERGEGDNYCVRSWLPFWTVVSSTVR